MSKEETKELEEIRKLAERNYELISKNTKNINKNFKKINDNSLALEILGDYKKESERLYKIVKTGKKVIIWILILFTIMVILLGLICVHHFILK